jgi:hypothetical protein
VEIAEGVEIIDDFAFANCATLIKYKEYEYNEDTGDTDYKGVYKKRLGLTSIIIPNSCKQIGESAFEKCTYLKSVNLSDGIEVIGKSAFNKCLNLYSISLPYTCKEIGETAFANCGNLVSTVIDKNGEPIKIVKIPENIEQIGEKAFMECNSIDTLELSGNLSNCTVGLNIFEGCVNIKNLITNDNKIAASILNSSNVESIIFNGTEQEFLMSNLYTVIFKDLTKYRIECTENSTSESVDWDDSASDFIDFESFEV